MSRKSCRILVTLAACASMLAGASAAMAQAKAIGPKPEDPKSSLDRQGAGMAGDSRRAIGPKPEDPRAKAMKGGAAQSAGGPMSIGPKPEDPAKQMTK